MEILLFDLVYEIDADFVLKRGILLYVNALQKYIENCMCGCKLKIHIVHWFFLGEAILDLM